MLLNFMFHTVVCMIHVRHRSEHAAFLFRLQCHFTAQYSLKSYHMNETTFINKCLKASFSPQALFFPIVLNSTVQDTFSSLPDDLCFC